MRYILAFILYFLFTGCIGIGVIKSHEKNVPFNPELENGKIRGNPKQYTKEQVLSLWGEPSKIEVENNKEDWVYSNRLRFNGLIVWAIIPIPLVLPTGFRDTTVHFENNLTVGALYEYSRTPTEMCSAVPIMWLVHGSTNSWCHIFEK